MTTQEPSPEDAVQRALDESPTAGVVRTLLVLCCALTIADGFDLGVVAYIAPALTAEWNLNPSALGYVFGSGLLGLAIGAVFFAPLADRMGRRSIIIVAATLTGLSMLASAFATSSDHFLVARLITGAGVGVLIPVLTTYVSEISKSSSRNVNVALIVAIGTVGSVIAALLSANLLDDVGWRWIVGGGGFVTLLLALVSFKMLSESPVFLSRGPGSDALQKTNVVLQRLGATPLQSVPEALSTSPAISVVKLFSGSYRVTTLVLWGVFIAINLFSYFMVSWTPQMLTQRGLSIELSIYAGMAFPVGAGVGAIVIAACARNRELRRIVILAFAVGCAAVLVLSALVWAKLWPYVIAFNFVSGFLISGGFASVFTIAATYYSTALRATAIGWCMGVSRVGAVIGPVIAGYLFERQVPVYKAYWLFLVPIFLAILCLAYLPRRPTLQPAD